MGYGAVMGLLDFLLRRKRPIADLPALADFIDAQAAFLVQKGIYDYARARSGHFAKVMLADKGFQEALDRARWRAYPLGLAMVGELTESLLVASADGDRRGLLEPLAALVLSIHDRYPQPATLSAAEWQAGRADLALHLERIGMHPPKRTLDIPESFFQRYFSLMPFDKPLLTPDAPTARGFLQLTLIAVQNQLIERMDSPALATQLRAS